MKRLSVAIRKNKQELILIRHHRFILIWPHWLGGWVWVDAGGGDLQRYPTALRAYHAACKEPNQ